MDTPHPATRRLTIAAVKEELSALVGEIRTHESRVVVEHNGEPVAAIVSTDDLRRLTELDREQSERVQLVEEMRAAFAGIPTEELEREAERAIRDARADYRARSDRHDDASR